MKKKKKTKLYEWQEKCRHPDARCAKCGETRFLTVDHIVPVHILLSFDFTTELAYEFEENFEILCRWCNQMKKGHIDPRNPKVYSVLRRVLDASEKLVFNKTNETISS